MAGAADELLLLERVFLRIGSAESDDQLQNAVGKFLPPVLLKLSSQQEGVRKKVMELLVHINKRIKSRALVQLPVESLLVQYQDPSASSFVTNFTIIYIKIGFPRLENDKQTELVPIILNALENKPQSHQDALLMLIVPLLGSVVMPTDPKKRASMFGLQEKPVVAKQLASIMLDMLLLPYGSVGQQLPSPEAESSGAQFPVPPGMSPYTFRRVTTGGGGLESPNINLKPDQLEQIKLGLVRFLSGGVYPDSEIVPHLVVAASDTRFSVANLADLELKKIIGGLNWGDASLSAPLFRLFLGSQGNVKPELKKSPVSTRIRLKLLHYLCRITGNGFVITPCIQVIFDSLYGTNTNTKLKTLALNFTTNIIQQADVNILRPVGKVLLCGLTKLTDEGERPHQGQAYVIVGLLGRRLPALVAHDLALLEALFKKLDVESVDMRLQIREGMLNLVGAYSYKTELAPNLEAPIESSNLQDSKMILLHSLLSQYMDSNEDIVRFIATRFMASVFPEKHVPSKFLLLLATGDNKDEITTESMKSLYGNLFSKFDDFSAENRLILPDFSEFIKYVYAQSIAMHQKSQKAPQIVAFPPKVFKEILIYSRLCLIKDLNVPKSRDVLRHPNEFTPVIGDILNEFFQKGDILEENPILQYLQLIKDLIKVETSVESLNILLEVVGTVKKSHVSFVSDLKWLHNLLSSSKEEVRETAAILYAILTANNQSDGDFTQTLCDLVSGTENNRKIESQHGCLLSLSHALERRAFSSQFSRENLDNLEKFSVISSFLTHQNALLVSGACFAVGLLGSCAPLPLPQGPNPDETKLTKLTIVEKLLFVMNNVKLPMKVRERAARGLGLLCTGEVFPHTREVLTGLLNTAKDTKDVEVHFTIGDSLVMGVQGVFAPEARDPWVCTPDKYTPHGLMIDAPCDEHFDWLMEELLALAAETHPNIRQACSIWLLTLLKKCPDREPVKTRLAAIQHTFMDLLNENNEIIVDVASKGLGLVFDSSRGDLGARLLDQLVDQLQSGRKAAPKVTSDTKLFEEGELGKSPTGGNLSTYKELCSLASDLNKPDLIYKFMQLANHNSIWNSKKGAAFGFLSIATKASEQLKPHLPKIIPKLFRYQFDPTPSIQNSMQRIWGTLVPEPLKTIEEFYAQILTDLVANLTAPQWRVRQSCCVGLCELWRSGANKGIQDEIGALEELWVQLFRVMDDVHEQTREKAIQTTAVLSKLCIRCCDENSGKKGTELLAVILPVLLNTGIVNTVPEVRAVSLRTVSHLVGSAGPQLGPFLPLLIPALLQATGELESTSNSYLSARFGANSQIQEVIDSARASAAKSHFTVETITKCLPLITAETLALLAPKVIELMRNSMTLATRIACAHFLALLSGQNGAALGPYCAKFLTVLVNGLTDRNGAVRKHYATTIGHLVRCAKDSSVEKLFAKLKLWYFERDDDVVRGAIGLTVQSIANYNQDTLKTYRTVVLPLVFFAMHADKTSETEATVEIWADIWAENSPGTDSGIRQNIDEICAILETSLSSPSWTMKSQGANCIHTVATTLGASLDDAHRAVLVRILVAGLAGRIFNGKEKLLRALAAISVNSLSEAKTNEIVEILLRESRKDDLEYKRQSLEALGDVLAALKIDRFEELYEIVQRILSADQSCDELTQEETSARRENLIKLKETMYETLGKAWPQNEATQEKYGQLFVQHCVECLPNCTRSVQVCVVAALCQYVDKLAALQGGPISPKSEEMFPSILENIFQALIYTLSISKYTRLRKEALNVVLSLARSLKGKRPQDFDRLREMFLQVLPNFENDLQPEIKSRVVDLKDLFN